MCVLFWCVAALPHARTGDHWEIRPPVCYFVVCCRVAVPPPRLRHPCNRPRHPKTQESRTAASRPLGPGRPRTPVDPHGRADQRGKPARQTNTADQHGIPARADQHGRPSRHASAWQTSTADPHGGQICADQHCSTANQQGRPARQTRRARQEPNMPKTPKEPK